ncbi:hypothetical protein [Flaviaesturariibacter terrae]
MHTTMPLFAPAQRRSYFHLIACLLGFLLAIAAPQKGFAQATADNAEVLQKCLDLPALQAFYPSGVDGAKQQVTILQLPVAFPAGLSVTKFEQPVLFVSRDGVGNKDAYINFLSFTVGDQDASADFFMTYGRNSTSPGSVRMKVTLSKVNDQWSVTNSTVVN